ncbi:MAG TPA: ABC transporter substrate-binding protein, partial [Chloroflexota bacterium]|nr:ABC transporter substrate-binding protein [Chloroflexota bacterium]
MDHRVGISRRHFLQGVTLASLVGLLAACTGSPLQVLTGRAPPETSTLRVGVLGDIPSLDPHQLTPPVPDVMFPVWDRLTTFAPHTTPGPELAETWHMSADGRELTLALRKGVQFHSGRELTSDDVKWNLMHVQDPKVAAGALILQSKWFTSVETPDKYTVVLGAEQPRPATFDFFEYFDIVDSETADAMQTLIGTGPFKFVEWAQGDHMLFARNPNYWQSGLPYLDEVRIVVEKDGQAMMVQLESGGLDVADAPPLPDFARLGNDSGYTVWRVASGTNV